MNLTYLERVDPARNMLRFYAIRIAPTLFGEWATVLEWGQIGSSGRGGGKGPFCYAPGFVRVRGATSLMKRVRASRTASLRSARPRAP